MAKLYKIDPTAFSTGAWQELAATTDLVTEERKLALRGAPRIRIAMDELRAKIGRIQAGLLGPETEPRENAAWLNDLHETISVLTDILHTGNQRTTVRVFVGYDLDGDAALYLEHVDTRTDKSLTFVTGEELNARLPDIQRAVANLFSRSEQR